MKIERKLLLKKLEVVSPGLSARETIDQSDCFVFHGGKITTFNDEVACSVDSPLDVDCVVQADPLLQLLSKLTEDEIDVGVADSKLMVKGKRRRAQIRCQSEMLLPVDDIESCGEWIPLSDGFSDALGIVSTCASDDHTLAAESMFTYVHVSPDWVEACDKQQACRFPIQTGLKIGGLIRKKSAMSLTGFGVTEIGESENWLHFQNDAGVVLSCRRYLGQYPDLGKHFSVEGTKVTLPSDMGSALSRCEIFGNEGGGCNRVSVSLKSGKVTFLGEGAAGRYEEYKKVDYDGKPLKFTTTPKLLLQIADRAAECEVSSRKLKVETDKFVYITCTVDGDD